MVIISLVYIFLGQKKIFRQLAKTKSWCKFKTPHQANNQNKSKHQQAEVEIEVAITYDHTTNLLQSATVNTMIKFNLVYFLVIVTHVLIELYFSLCKCYQCFYFVLNEFDSFWKITLVQKVTDEISQNPFLKQYDKLNYDTKHLHDRHLRVQRSIDNHLYFTFNSHGR